MRWYPQACASEFKRRLARTLGGGCFSAAQVPTGLHLSHYSQIAIRGGTQVDLLTVPTAEA